MKKLFIILIFFLVPVHLFAAEIIFRPEKPIQGEPVAIVLSGVTATSSIKSATIGKENLNFLFYKGEVMALYGFDLTAKAGTSTVVVNLENGESLKKELVLQKRPQIEAPLEIPKKLGGNTPEAAKKLVTNLIDEQAIVKKITGIVRPKAFFTDSFVFPAKNPIVTDTYGYSRNTVGYQIAHKGTDFRAKIGDPVMSINRGVVRDVRVYPTFGRTVIVDHGRGIYSMYLHLSKSRVNVGELVRRGQVIGSAGDTGYATGPHLHLSIRVNGVSVDPMAFFKIFNLSI